MDSVDDRLSLAAAAAFQRGVREAGGQEICCVGKLDAEGVVESVTVTARGNEEAVPALMPHLERGDVVIHNHPSGHLRPSAADIQVASHLGNLGIGFYIVDNVVDRVYVVAEPYLRKEIVPLALAELVETLEPGGRLSGVMKGYESRESQQEMLESVASAFNEDAIYVAEAGTGVGKSLAYLIPAIRWVAQNDERVVVSTATINLQQQLVERDIPQVLRLLGSDVRTALVKGRGNYVCLRKLDDALGEDSLFKEGDGDLLAIREWAKTTKDGSRSDLAILPSERTWSRVASEADTCVGLRCRFRERCFVLQARREAASAQLLVVNHHMLFSDLAMRLSGAGYENTAVLPPFQRIVFDEAHNIENSATSYFSESLHKHALARQAGRLYRVRKGRPLGLARSLARLAREEAAVDELAALVRDVVERAEALDALALGLLGGESTARFSGAITEEVRAAVLDPMNEVRAVLVTLINRVSDVMNGLDEEQLDSPDAYEARIICDRLGAFARLCEAFGRFDETPDKVFWASRSVSYDGESFAEFVMTPLDVAPLMREAVFEPYPTVVCTSATLTVRNDFAFWLSRVGLAGFEGREVATERLPSPFPYKERVLLGVPTDAPDPTEPGYQAFVSDFVARALEASGGSGLVLFTSYAMLRDTFDAVESRLRPLGITVLKQGDGDRARLLNRFTADVSSVLFATDSFWEGVDAPGDTLRMVIICRLPFKVPTDPVMMARTEALDRATGNSFGAYALPTAVMRLKQGFGRLMRRQTDHGVVVILDPRVVRKSYGAAFIASLPETRRSMKPAPRLLHDIERFFSER